MKFALAILATTAFAVRTQAQDDCVSEWEWDDCYQAWWQADWCAGATDCGWWYSAGLDDDWSDDWWVTCDEWEGAECELACDEPWEWDDWWQAWWREGCSWEGDSDCGWVYWDDWLGEEYWVDCLEWD